MKLIPSAGVIAYEHIYVPKKTKGGLTAPDKGVYGKVLAVGAAKDGVAPVVKEGSTIVLWPGHHSEVPLYVDGVVTYLCFEDAVAAVVE